MCTTALLECIILFVIAFHLICTYMHAHIKKSGGTVEFFYVQFCVVLASDITRESANIFNICNIYSVIYRCCLVCMHYRHVLFGC